MSKLRKRFYFSWLFPVLIIFFLIYLSIFTSSGSYAHAQSVIPSTAPSSSASTAYGVNMDQGYFSGSTYSSGSYLFGSTTNVAFEGITPDPGTLTAQTYISYIEERLDDTSSVSDQADAAAVVDIILGQSGPSFSGSYENGITYAQNNFQTFENLINSYDQQTTPGYSVQWKY